MKVFKSSMLAAELNPFVRLGENYPGKLLYKKANFTYTTVQLLYLVCISNCSRWFSYIAVVNCSFFYFVGEGECYSCPRVSFGWRREIPTS